MLTLYPAISPYEKHNLEVDNIHTIYVEESGNPKGIPILFLHGGPGAGCDPDHRRFFNPDYYRIILFDQRGAGKSTPHSELENNTTVELLSDIEFIRKYLNIEQFVLFGGSWGSTLALLYAQAHPNRVSNMILRGIFLGRQKDFDWFYKDGASRIFPEYWDDYIKEIPNKSRDNIIDAYYEFLTGKDEVSRMAHAKAWAKWEGSCATLDPSNDILDKFTNVHTALALARIECHYFKNNIFIKENQIIENMHKIKDIPGTIVHGRYDMICPMDNAIELFNVWPNANLQIIRDAGHAACEPGIVNALIKATNSLIR